MTALPFPLPPPAAVLLRGRAQALGYLEAAGWRPWVEQSDLAAEERRLLNLDLSEPDLAFLDAQGDIRAVARLEADPDGEVVLLEITAGDPYPALELAGALFPGAGPPLVEGEAAARVWIWGPEARSGLEVGGEPVRLWVCAESAHRDRLWAVLSVVRRGSDEE